MVKYSQEPDQANKAAKARGGNLRVHFKHAREVCNAIKGMKLERAKAYLQNVIDYKETVTFTKFTGGCGRHAQAKNHSASGSKGRWPQKASKMILDLVRNAEANAEMKGISVDDLIVSHSQANRAMQQRRRTYRAHGRINPYMSSPAHIELILSEAPEKVAKADDDKKPVSRKRRAQLRTKEGGGAE